MDRQSAFSYRCNQCGRCCHNQTITLSPVDVIAIARTCGIGTGEAVARYAIRRGSLLRFGANGGCAALDGVRCSIHRGRPLACRLYPLGLERDGPREHAGAMERDGAGERDGERERFIQLEAAPGSAGVFGAHGTVAEFLAGQGIDEQLALNERYRPLLGMMRDHIGRLVDFDIVESREFWRRAIAEALREMNFDANRIIDAIFDADGVGCARDSVAATVEAHLTALTEIARRETDAVTIAVAAVLLAVSLGYAPAEAMVGAKV